jgi:hypothetical protein
VTLKEVPSNCCDCDEVIDFFTWKCLPSVSCCLLVSSHYLQVPTNSIPAVSMNIRPYNPVLLIPFSISNLEKLIHILVLQLAKKYPMFIGIWKYMIVFRIAYSWCLYWTRWILPTYWYPVRLRSILLLAYNLHLSFICRHLLSGFFFHQNHVSFCICVMYAACPSHLIHLDFIAHIMSGQENKS